MEVEGFLWEMVASYGNGSCKVEVRPLVMGWSGRAKRSLSLIESFKICLGKMFLLGVFPSLGIQRFKGKHPLKSRMKT